MRERETEITKERESFVPDFWTRGPAISFCTVLANYAASPAWPFSMDEDEDDDDEEDDANERGRKDKEKGGGGQKECFY